MNIWMTIWLCVWYGSGWAWRPEKRNKQVLCFGFPLLLLGYQQKLYHVPRWSHLPLRRVPGKCRSLCFTFGWLPIASTWAPSNRYAVALHGPKNPAINVWYQGPPKAMQSSGWFEIVHGGLQLGTIKLRCTECYIYDCLKMTHGCIVKKREDNLPSF